MLSTSGQSLIYSQGDETPIISSGSLANANCIPQSSSAAISGGYGGIIILLLSMNFLHLVPTLKMTAVMLILLPTVLKQLN